MLQIKRSRSYQISGRAGQQQQQRRFGRKIVTKNLGVERRKVVYY
jgi:hypothetical protein